MSVNDAIRQYENAINFGKKKVFFFGKDDWEPQNQLLQYLGIRYNSCFNLPEDLIKHKDRFMKDDTLVAVCFELICGLSATSEYLAELLEDRGNDELTIFFSYRLSPKNKDIWNRMPNLLKEQMSEFEYIEF